MDVGCIAKILSDIETSADNYDTKKKIVADDLDEAVKSAYKRRKIDLGSILGKVQIPACWGLRACRRPVRTKDEINGLVDRTLSCVDCEFRESCTSSRSIDLGTQTVMFSKQSRDELRVISKRLWISNIIQVLIYLKLGGTLEEVEDGIRGNSR